jgi:predicted dehydrogenase
MSDELGFGIVGTGMVARYHAQAIADTQGAYLAAVCRNDPNRAGVAAAELGVPCEPDLEALLARDDVDAVCLCSPSGLHAEQAVAAAQAGKHVLVEKPMALTLPDADTMIRVCRDANVRLGVVYQRRTDPATRELHDAIRAGELGPLVLGTASVPYFRDSDYYESAAWRGTWTLDGGGALMNQGIHLVDLLLWLMGGEAEVVGASGSALSHAVDVEDTVVAALHFSNDARGTLVATTAAAPGFPHRVEVYGTKGGAQVEGDSVVRWEGEVPRLSTAESGAVGAGAGGAATGIDVFGHQRIIEDFTVAISEGREPLVNGEEGRRSLALVLGIYAAAGLGAEHHP